MKILIYGINYSPELTATGKYTGEMAEWLSAENQDVRVVTAPPYYPHWKVMPPYNSWKFMKENISGVLVFRCPLYVPKKVSTFKRIIHLTSFSLSSALQLFRNIFWKPDIIICVAPTMICVPFAKLYSKITKAKLIIHVQDYEVDAMFGLNLASTGILSGLARTFERWCLKQASLVSTISTTMLNKAVSKGVDSGKALYFPNWSELNRFKNINSDEVSLLRNELKLPTDKKIILYSGNVGDKQGLEIIPDIAPLPAFSDSIFLIVGEGAGKKRLEEKVQQCNLNNIIFRPLQPYEKLPFLLSIADCHLVIQKKGAADAVLPSKLTNILAIGGNAVITAETQTELGQLVNKYPGVAVLVEPENASSLADGLIHALTLPRYNDIAMRYAHEQLDKDEILKNYFHAISEVVYR
ncbi:TPA: glycosyltransferase WbuB [Raoultella planticola]